MAEFHVLAYRYARTGTANDLRVFLEEQAKRVSHGSEAFPSELRSERDDHDEEALDHIEIRRYLRRGIAQQLRRRVDRRHNRSRSSMGIRTAKIMIPVKLGGGNGDVFSPIHHKYWLAERINGAKVEIERGKAHFGTVLLKSLTWWRGRRTRNSRRELMP
jgi:pimeloyl-ACP methyl ester carboxylesterase